MQKVIFDSSFLMAVAEKTTTWSEDMVLLVGRFQPILLDCVRAELLKLSSGGGRKSKIAKVSLELAAGFSSRPCGGAEADAEIVSAALETGAVVATVDGDLLQTLAGVHLKAIALKSGRVAFAP